MIGLLQSSKTFDPFTLLPPPAGVNCELSPVSKSADQTTVPMLSAGWKYARVGAGVEMPNVASPANSVRAPMNAYPLT
jgi:hypothetical protein